jgi:hypothetical protein
MTRLDMTRLGITRLAPSEGLCRAAVAALFAVALAVAAGSASAQNGASPPGAAAPAAAQAPPPTTSTPLVPPQPPAPPATDNPSLLHQLKAWWDDSTAVFGSKRDDAGVDHSKKPGDAAGDRTKDTATNGGTDGAKDGATNGADSAADATKGAATTATDAVKNAVEATKNAASTATDAMKGAVEATKNAADALARLPGLRIVDIHETCARAPNGAPDCAAAAANGCRGKGYSTGNPLEVRSSQACNTKPLQSGNLEKPIGCGSEAVVIRAMCQ